jgi:hypothetical protein
MNSDSLSLARGALKSLRQREVHEADRVAHLGPERHSGAVPADADALKCNLQ